MFKVDFINGTAISWEKLDGKVEAERHPEYRPRFYIEGDKSKLQKSRVWLTDQRGIKATCFEKWKPTLSKPRQKVLRVDCTSEEKLKKAVGRLKKGFGRSTFRFYNVGFSPQFRFCLQEEICPVPGEKLEIVEISLARRHLAHEKIREIELNGEKLGQNKAKVLENLKEYWQRNDPDIIIVNRGQVLKLLTEKFQEHRIDFSFGRLKQFQKLAGENTVSSYGRTQHSSARYNIPGRIVLDKSNSFLLGEATLEGLWDLVNRSYRPLQELAWGSIGRVLTSIEARKAYLEENTLTPWKNWRGEKPKKASTLHKADRGGFIFNPEPDIHQNVYEADFASLFPNIMIKKNISPETVCCDCCDNSEVPELDYSICQNQRGFISETLKPLVRDRQEMKNKVGKLEGRERKQVQGSIDAIKWLLVSCFGYMGHAHASYGAIRCHQAIQAYDREIMVKTKEMFEEAGYSISHGIIDSIWVQEKENAVDFEDVCESISEEIGIELEPEHKFEWVAFVPRSSSDADISTLNRYFGRKENGEFKTAGIEVEQRSTCEFVKKAQMEMIEALDKKMSPEDVLEVLKEKLEQLEEDVEVRNLVITRKVSKSLGQYKVENRGFAALKRAKYNGIDVKPGQSAHFIVRDDEADPMDRVRLDFEAESYDRDFYKKRLIKAAESVLSPLGYNKERLTNEVNSEKARKITAF